MRGYPDTLVAITGIGQSEVARPSLKSALALTVEACSAALHDAGLDRTQIKGIATYPGAVDTGSGFSPVGAVDVRLSMGLRPDWFTSTGLDSGGGPLSAVFAGMNAIAARVVDHVLVFRTVAEATARSATRNAMLWGNDAPRVWGYWSWAVPFGIQSPAPWYALFAQRHFKEFGTTSRQLGSIAVHNRKMAALNPKAIYREPITINDYLESRMISTPLRLFDCDVPVDGSTAFVLSRADIARDMPNPPIVIESTGSAMHHGGLRRPDSLTSFGAESASRMMWSNSKLSPEDIDVAQIYDGFSILTLTWLEALGFCGKGEGGSFVEDSGRFEPNGRLPMNTSGGQLSAGRLHGAGHLHEACLQLRGQGGARQVPGTPRNAVVCAGAYGLGCMTLIRD